MSEFDVLVKHVHAHVDVSSSGLVCWVKAHGNRPFVVHIDVGGTRIAKTKVLCILRCIQVICLHS